mmetsp:Transcript_4748/g.10440  ORF Transcript_4748/g.10440 Transcript_4748/m.10440 type:complete len:204 (-) Transcript_4748:797-1408(-)
MLVSANSNINPNTTNNLLLLDELELEPKPWTEAGCCFRNFPVFFGSLWMALLDRGLLLWCSITFPTCWFPVLSSFNFLFLLSHSVLASTFLLVAPAAALKGSFLAFHPDTSNPLNSSIFETSLLVRMGFANRKHSALETPLGFATKTIFVLPPLLLSLLLLLVVPKALCNMEDGRTLPLPLPLPSTPTVAAPSLSLSRTTIPS